MRGEVNAERAGKSNAASGHRHWHERHRVVAEDVDDFRGDRVAAGLRLGVCRREEVAVAAGAEALPLVLEDVGPGPALFEVDQFLARVHHAGQFAFHAHASRHLDDFPAALVVEIHRPVVHPIGPLLREHLAGFDTLLVFADFDEIAGFAHDLAFVGFQLGGGQSTIG